MNITTPQRDKDDFLDGRIDALTGILEAMLSLVPEGENLEKLQAFIDNGPPEFHNAQNREGWDDVMAKFRTAIQYPEEITG